MATASTTTPPLGWKAEDFDLEGTDGKRHRLADLKGPKGTLVMFICNHCPYVQAVLDDIIADARELQAAGVASVAIMPNDTRHIPGQFLRQHEAAGGGEEIPLPLSPGFDARRWRGLMTPPARRISSASTPIWGCNIAAASMRAATASASPEASASSTRPCSRSPAAARARRTRRRAWAARSNGGRNRSALDQDGRRSSLTEGRMKRKAR